MDGKNSLMCALMMLGAVAGAEELAINGTFLKSVPGKEVPSGWTRIQTSFGSGSAEVIPGEAKDSIAFRIKTEDRKITYLSGRQYPAKGGQKLTITVRAKGGGRFVVGCYLYDAKRNAIGGEGRSFSLASNGKTEIASIPLADTKNAKLDGIRIFFAAEKDTDLTVSEIKAEVLGQ